MASARKVCWRSPPAPASPRTRACNPPSLDKCIRPTTQPLRRNRKLVRNPHCPAPPPNMSCPVPRRVHEPPPHRKSNVYPGGGFCLETYPETPGCSRYRAMDSSRQILIGGSSAAVFFASPTCSHFDV